MKQNKCDLKGKTDIFPVGKDQRFSLPVLRVVFHCSLAFDFIGLQVINRINQVNRVNELFEGFYHVFTVILCLHHRGRTLVFTIRQPMKHTDKETHDGVNQPVLVSCFSFSDQL